MSSNAVTLQLPPSVYELFASRAKQMKRSLERELLDVVTTAAEEERSARVLDAAVQSLRMLDDENLWRAARNTISDEQYAELQQLNEKSQSEGLTKSDERRQTELLHAYDRAVVIRAEAARLLKERGHEIAVLLAER